MRESWLIPKYIDPVMFSLVATKYRFWQSKCNLWECPQGYDGLFATIELGLPCRGLGSR
ncbi:hypothetical protein Hgul01_02096 [Herpetosiphon gulosus]|uniref:Uncharacterized protein n=1 Tax=Herpetosiphon gulosus TaxID=1973496 RepID=A0ABP9X0E2_9CHLR